MFLYARVIIDTLWHFDDVEDICSELKCLPETLDEA